MDPKTEQRLMLNREDRITEELISSGLLFLDAPIVPEIASKFNKSLLYLAMKHKKEDKKPIWIYLDSLGGFVPSGLAIYDVISASVSDGVVINILGVGVVASMALTIMQAAGRGHRFSLPHTQFLLHQVSQESVGSAEYNQVKEQTAEMERINKLVMGIVAEGAKIDLEKLLQLSEKKNCWFSPMDAKKFGELGLIDEVLSTLPFPLV